MVNINTSLSTCMYVYYRSNKNSNPILEIKWLFRHIMSIPLYHYNWPMTSDNIEVSAGKKNSDSVNKRVQLRKLKSLQYDIRIVTNKMCMLTLPAVVAGVSQLHRIGILSVLYIYCISIKIAICINRAGAINDTNFLSIFNFNNFNLYILYKYSTDQ